MSVVADVVARLRTDSSELLPGLQGAQQAIDNLGQGAGSSGMSTLTDHFSKAGSAAKGFSAEASVGANALSGLATEANRVKDSLLGVAGIASLAAGFAGFVEITKNYTSTLETLQVQFGSTFGPTSQANLAQSANLANQLGVSFQNMGSAYSGFAVATKGHAENFTADMKTFQDVAAGTGSSIDQVASSVDNYFQLIQRMGGAGGSASRYASSLLTQHIIDPETYNQLRFAAQQGADTQKLLQMILADAEKQYSGAGQALGGTLTNRLQTFRNELESAVGGAGKPLMDSFAQGLDRVGAALSGPGFKTAATDIADFTREIARGAEMVVNFGSGIVHAVAPVAGFVGELMKVKPLVEGIGALLAGLLVLDFTRHMIIGVETLYGKLASYLQGLAQWTTGTQTVQAEELSLTDAISLQTQALAAEIAVVNQLIVSFQTLAASEAGAASAGGIAAGASGGAGLGLVASSAATWQRLGPFSNEAFTAAEAAQMPSMSIQEADLAAGLGGGGLLAGIRGASSLSTGARLGVGLAGFIGNQFLVPEAAKVGGEGSTASQITSGLARVGSFAAMGGAVGGPIGAGVGGLLGSGISIFEDFKPHVDAATQALEKMQQAAEQASQTFLQQHSMATAEDINSTYGAAMANLSAAHAAATPGEGVTKGIQTALDELRAVQGARFNEGQNLQYIQRVGNMSQSQAEQFAQTNSIDLSQRLTNNLYNLNAALGTTGLTAEALANKLNTVSQIVTGAWGATTYDPQALLKQQGITPQILMQMAAGTGNAAFGAGMMPSAYNIGPDGRPIMLGQTATVGNILGMGGMDMASMGQALQKAGIPLSEFNANVSATGFLTQAAAQAMVQQIENEDSLRNATMGLTQAQEQVLDATFALTQAQIALAVGIANSAQSLQNAGQIASQGFPMLVPTLDQTLTLIQQLAAHGMGSATLSALGTGLANAVQAIEPMYNSLQQMTVAAQQTQNSLNAATAALKTYQDQMNVPLQGQQQYTLLENQIKAQMAPYQLQQAQLQAAGVPSESLQMQGINRIIANFQSQLQIAALQQQLGPTGSQMASPLGTALTTSYGGISQVVNNAVGVAPQGGTQYVSTLGGVLAQGPGQGADTYLASAQGAGTVEGTVRKLTQSYDDQNAKITALNASMTPLGVDLATAITRTQQEASAVQQAASAAQQDAQASLSLKDAYVGLQSAGVQAANAADNLANTLLTLAGTGAGSFADFMSKINSSIVDGGQQLETTYGNTMQALDQITQISGSIIKAEAAGASETSSQINNAYKAIQNLTTGAWGPLAQKDLNSILGQLVPPSTPQGLATSVGQGFAAQQKQAGGFVEGAYGSAVPIVAHGGEFVIGLAAIQALNAGVPINISGAGGASSSSSSSVGGPDIISGVTQQASHASDMVNTLTGKYKDNSDIAVILTGNTSNLTGANNILNNANQNVRTSTSLLSTALYGSGLYSALGNVQSNTDSLTTRFNTVLTPAIAGVDSQSKTTTGSIQTLTSTLSQLASAVTSVISAAGGVTSTGAVGNVTSPTSGAGWANVSQQQISQLQALAGQGKLSGVDPRILAAIDLAESSGIGGGINSSGYGGFFGLGANTKYPGGGSISSATMLQNNLQSFTQQAIVAAAEFASLMKSRGGNPYAAESAYQGGSAEGTSIFSALGIPHSYQAGGSVPSTGPAILHGGEFVIGLAAIQALNAGVPVVLSGNSSVSGSGKSITFSPGSVIVNVNVSGIVNTELAGEIETGVANVVTQILDDWAGH